MKNQRDKLIELIVNAKRADPETCSFTEFLADFMLGYGVFVPDDGYDLDRLRELMEADKEGRCVVLPFPLHRMLLNTSDPYNPELMKDFRISATWTHCGIVFHSKAALDMPLWVPLAFLALVSLAGAAAERSGK